MKQKKQVDKSKREKPLKIKGSLDEVLKVMINSKSPILKKRKGKKKT